MDFYYSPIFKLPDIKNSEDRRDSMENGSVRIKSITFSNFKSVKHGTIDFNPGKSIMRHADQSNILALYGQNGSGKTTVIEILYILKQVLCGKPLPGNVADIISQDSKSASVKVVFEYQREDSSDTEFITYSFGIERCKKKKIVYHDEKFIITGLITHEQLTVNVRDENGVLVKKTRKFFDSDSSYPVLNGSLIEVFVYDAYISSEQTSKIQRIPYEGLDDVEESYSSKLFGNWELCNVAFTNFTKESPWVEDLHAISPNKYDYLELLNRFGEDYLMIAGANLFNAFSGNAAPMYFKDGLVKTYSNKPSELDFRDTVYLKRRMNKFNEVLSQVIPGIELNIKLTVPSGLEELKAVIEELSSHSDIDFYRGFSFGETASWSNDEGQYYRVEIPERVLKSIIKAEFYTKRNGATIPLAEESEGIKRIIYVLDLIVAAYNNPSITVAIDELDAGVYEYLLGEILQIFEESGKGQLIFTSHNLRPLEVISKNFVCFTTTNPENRYVRLKYVNATNNLRDVYFRQIIIGDQPEELYKHTKKYKLVEAFEKAGEA